jgi:hypothetical protein
LLTAFLHVGFFFGIPNDLFEVEATEKGAEPSVYEVALLPPEEEELRFVQTNPEVPQNKPDPTDQFANRDQQAAQEDPEPDSNDSMPTVEGENEESTQILEGSLEDPTPVAPPPSTAQQPSPPTPEEPEQQETALPEDTSPERARPEIRSIAEEEPAPPLPDFIQQEPDSDEGPGSTLGPIGESREIPEEESERIIPITAPLPVESEPVPGAIQPPTDSSSPGEKNPIPLNYSPASEESPPSPRPRPRLRPNVVPAPLMDSDFSASRTGVLAVDAEFSEFGDYLQRMVEAVSRAWNASAERVELIKERPSRVKVRVTIDSRGNISDIRVVDKTPNAQLLATGLCMDAIKSREPYDRWTYDMIQVLGTEQEITFTFYYR